MNIHWGLFNPLLPEDIPQETPNVKHGKDGTLKIDKGTKRSLFSARSQRDFTKWLHELKSNSIQ